MKTMMFTVKAVGLLCFVVLTNDLKVLHIKFFSCHLINTLDDSSVVQNVRIILKFKKRVLVFFF